MAHQPGGPPVTRTLPRAPARIPRRLTRLQLDILYLVADGYTATQAAGIAGVTEESVKVAKKGLMTFLSAMNSPHTIHLGYTNGYLPAPKGWEEQVKERAAERVRKRARLSSNSERDR